MQSCDHENNTVQCASQLAGGTFGQVQLDMTCHHSRPKLWRCPPEGLEFLAQVLLHHGAELGHAPVRHQVLQPCLLPVVSPTCMTTQRKHQRHRSGSARGLAHSLQAGSGSPQHLSWVVLPAAALICHQQPPADAHACAQLPCNTMCSRAFTIVALRGHDRLDGVQQVVLGDVADGVRQPREGARVAMRPPHAAAHQQVVALHQAAGQCRWNLFL